MSLSELTTPSIFDPYAIRFGGVQLIEASAGTGKTWNISALYLRALLETKLTVEEMLVVTFTKAATAELRERIRSRIAALNELMEPVSTAAEFAPPDGTDPFLLRVMMWIQSQSDDEINHLKAKLRLALQSFDQATILTIHGFCQRALDDAPFVSGSPLGSELVIDDSEIRDELIQDYWRCKVLASDTAPILVRALSLKGLNPEKLSELLQRCLSKPLAHSIWPTDSVNLESVEKYEKELKETWESLRQLWKEERSVVCSAIDSMIEKKELDSRVFTKSSFEKAQEDWNHILRSGPWAEVAGDKKKIKLHLFRADKLTPTQTAQKKGAKTPDHSFYPLAQHYLDTKDQLTQQSDLIAKVFLRDMLETLVPKIKQRKRSLRIYSFDDMLRNLHDALMGPQGETLAQFLRTQFPIALVDEFQDTDPLQLAILEKIYTNQEGDASLFLVGDPKQAIYSFRNADLPTYLRARSQASVCWTLSKNQRASQPLIDACNTLFTQRPDAFLQPGLEYQSVSFGEKKRTTLEDDTQQGAAMNIWLLPQDGEGNYLRVKPARLRCAESCATEIVRLLKCGHQNEIRISGKGLQAGDIAVLVRSHYEGMLMRQALELRGVSCVERSPMNIFRTPDAEEWLCLLRALAEPRDEGKVLAALATRMLGYNAKRICELQQPESDLEWLMGNFMSYHTLWAKRGFGFSIRKMLDEFKVFETLLAAPDGFRRMTNLQHLMEWLQDMARLHHGPLALLRQFESAMRREQGNEEQEQRLETDAHLVQIMTIHRAKGLEFPVVFCPFLWTSTPSSTSHGIAREYHDEMGNTVMDYRDDDSIGEDKLDRIKDRQKKEREAEYVRLIYVALTRASLRCYVCAGLFSGTNQKDPTKTSSQAPLNALIQNTYRQPDSSNGSHPVERCWHDLAAGSELASNSLHVCTLIEPTQDRFEAVSEHEPTYEAADPPQSIPRRFRVDSFSGLQKQGEMGLGRTMQSEMEESSQGKDHDERGDIQQGTENEFATDLQSSSKDEDKDTARADILKFPRGKHEGTFLHKVLENAQLSQAQTWPDHVEKTLNDFSQLLNLNRAQIKPKRAQEMVLGMLRNIAECSLPQGFSLEDVNTSRQYAELEFYLPAHSVSPHGLYMLLQRHGIQIPRYQFELMEGYLKGFIDLVFEYQGQWFILDWKSNHLGDLPEDYSAQSVQAEMDKQGYVLQAVLYTFALHRFLKQRIPHYAPDQHLGGGLYVFLRGFREEWRPAMPSGETPGLWSFQPSKSLIQDLDTLFDGHPLGGEHAHV